MTTTADLQILNPASYVPPHGMFYGPLGSVATPVTIDTPLPVAVQNGLASQSLFERLNREGDAISANAATTFASFAAPTGAGTSGPFGMPGLAAGRAHYIQQVSYWSTTPIAGRLQIGLSNWATGVGTPPQLDTSFACGPNLSCPPILANVLIRSSDKAGAGMYVTKWLDPAVTGTHYVGSTVTGFQLADSINFDAKTVFLFLGDSLWNGTGPSSVQTCIPWLVNKFYRDQGIDCRYILKAYSGSISGGHETFRQGGKYDFPQVDAIFYNLGVNDAAQGYTTAASMANIQALIAWKQKRYPTARLVILGPTPVQPSYESVLVALRSAQQDYIAALGDPRVLFCDLGNSFDRALNANYASSDTAGSALHPGDAGLTQEWAGGFGANPGLRAWLTSNLPTI